MLCDTADAEEQAAKKPKTCVARNKCSAGFDDEEAEPFDDSSGDESALYGVTRMCQADEPEDQQGTERISPKRKG